MAGDAPYPMESDDIDFDTISTLLASQSSTEGRVASPMLFKTESEEARALAAAPDPTPVLRGAHFSTNVMHDGVEQAKRFMFEQGGGGGGGLGGVAVGPGGIQQNKRVGKGGLTEVVVAPAQHGGAMSPAGGSRRGTAG